MENKSKRRSALSIMGHLIVLVKPLVPVMILAVVLGVIGYLCAISLTILASMGVLNIIGEGYQGINLTALFVILVVVAVSRGILHYGEQYCNHFIAFKLLAIIRHKVFAALRKLCPAKLEGRDKGNLISIITSDIELLEVFYAHTISPIAIGIITSVIMTVFIWKQNIFAGLIALLAYITVGFIIPLINGKRGGNKGLEFRNAFGDLNSFVLDSLRGLDETIQYNDGENHLRVMEEKSSDLAKKQKELNKLEKAQRSVTNFAVMIFGCAMFFVMLCLYISGKTSFDSMIVSTVAMMASFGPVIALSNLSNNLNQTLASGDRVLSILEEKPEVEEVSDMEDVDFNGACVNDVSFAYKDETILKDYSLTIPKNKIIGIHGASGSGKSTLLKLLMRFWDVDKGSVNISSKNIKELNTVNLRNMESFVTQETYLFHDSIASNIAVGKVDATREEIIEAAKKASIHDFILSLPHGYDTNVGELGDSLSGGEKQRIGIARAFLHDAPFILLDEPTSNLDSLNEGIILKSLKDSCDSKTVVLVSHRKSTMNIADFTVEMDNGRIS